MTPSFIYPSQSTLESFARMPGVRYWTFDETYYPRRPSATIQSAISNMTPSLRVNSRQWLVEASPSAGFALQSGLLTYGQNIIYESNLPNQFLLSRHPLFRFSFKSANRPPGWWHRRRKLHTTVQPLIYFSTHNNPNYYHWFTQPGLSPLFLHDYFKLKLPSSSILALSSRPRHSLPPYVSQLLKLFAPSLPIYIGASIASSRSCRFALQENITAISLSSSQVRWLHSRCSALIHKPLKPSRNIFLSRSSAHHRRCLNEQEIRSHLTIYNFEFYCLEDLNVFEQLKLFSESKLIVGVHGAAFTNLVACSPGTSVVELLPQSGDYSHYYVLSDILNLNHGHLIGEIRNPATSDFSIDISKLLQLLQKMSTI